MLEPTFAARQEQRRDRSRELLVLYGITDDDLARIARYGSLVSKRIDVYVDKFYTWLAQQPEFSRYFADPAKLERVKNLQLEHWAEFFRGRVDRHYIEQRELVGNVHARIGLPLPTYFAAMNFSAQIFLDDLYDGSLTPGEFAATARSISELMNLDTSIVVDTYPRA